MNRFSQIKLAQGNIVLQKLIQAVGKKPDQMHPKKGGQVELVWLVPYKLEDQGWSLSVTLTTNRILVDLYLDVNYDSSDGGEVDFNDLYGHLARFNMKQINQAAAF